MNTTGSKKTNEVPFAVTAKQQQIINIIKSDKEKLLFIPLNKYKILQTIKNPTT
jgi:hypothetical protein